MWLPIDLFRGDGRRRWRHSYFPAHVATFGICFWKRRDLPRALARAPAYRPIGWRTTQHATVCFPDGLPNQIWYVFESHLRFPVVFQNSNRRRFFFWKFHCCFRARRPRRHNIQTTITRWITCRKQNIGKKKNVAHLKCGYAIIADSFLRDFLRFVHPPRQHWPQFL